MPLTEKGETIKKALQEEYGKEKGERVLYAGENKGTFSGIHDEPEEREPLEQFRIAPGDIELANRVYGPMFGEEEEEREPDAELRDAIRGRNDAITTHGAHKAAHVLLTRHGGSHPGPHTDERDQMMSMPMESMMDQVDPAPGVSRNEQEGMAGYSNPAGEPLPTAARDDKITHGSKDEVAEYTTTQVGPPGMSLAELQKANEQFWRQKVPGT